MSQKILKAPLTTLVIAGLLVLAALFGTAIFSSIYDPPLPAECNTEGGTELTLRTGEYFILDGESLSWSGVSFQNGPGSEEYWNIPLNVGESYATGLAYNEDGSYYYKWTIFRCGRNRFSVWKTQNLPPVPPPAPTPTPVAVIK